MASDARTKAIRKINREHRHLNFHEDETPLSGTEVMETIIDHSGKTCLLSFSGGKDSLCAWLVLREHFDRIVPFYMYGTPGLVWVNRILDFYEEWFGTRIYRVPNPLLYKKLRLFVHQTPNRWAWIDSADLPAFDARDIQMLVARQEGLSPEETFTATGVRAFDNIQRRIAVKKYGPIHWGNQTFMPIWDVNKRQVVDMLEAHGVPLSVDYQWFGRSFDGIDYRFIREIRTHAPEDWKHILDWFPMAWLEIERYETVHRAYPYGELGG